MGRANHLAAVTLLATVATAPVEAVAGAPGAVATPEQAWKIGWPCLTGPYHTWAAVPSGLKLVDDANGIRHMWRSEERIPSTKEQNAGWIGKVMRSGDRAPLSGGASSPILVDGRAYLCYYEPSGRAFDEVERYGGMRFNAGNATWPYLKRLHFMKTGAVNVARIEADDIVLCVDAMTGRTLWKRRFTGKGNNYQTRKDPGLNQRTMCHAEGKVYDLGSNCRLYAMDAVSGELLWEAATTDHQRYRQDKLHDLATRRRSHYLSPGHGFGYESLLAIDGRVIAKTAGGGLEAFDAATGRRVWIQPQAGVHGTNPMPGVWRHAGQTFLLGATRGTVTCTDAATGKVAWRKGGFASDLNQVIARGDVLVAAVRLPHADPKVELAQYAGYTISPKGLKLRWRLDPAVGGYFYQGNYRSIGHDGLLYLGRHPKTVRHGKDSVHDYARDWLALNPASGEIQATYRSDKPERCHHVAMVTLDDGRIWSKFGYRNYLYLRADAATAFTPLPQITDEGDMFGSAYSCPVAQPYAAGRMIVRGERYLHGLDFRAEAKDEPAASPIPAWAGELAEPVRGMASRCHTQREEALKRFAAIDKDQRNRRLPQLLRLLDSGDTTAELAAARALAAGDLDKGKVTPALRAAIARAVAAGRGELADRLANALVASDPAAAAGVAAEVAKSLDEEETPKAIAACHALGGFGPAASDALDSLVGQLTTSDRVVLRAALDALVRIDRRNRMAEEIVALLRDEDYDRRLLAADALAEMGPPVAAVALPEIEALLQPVEKTFLESGSNGRPGRGLTGQDQLLAGRLVYLSGRLGSAAAPLLTRLAKSAPADRPGRAEVLGALAELGPPAAKVAEVWLKSGAEQERVLALALVEAMVRHNVSAAAIEPFCKPLLERDATAVKVRSAEWLLGLDGSDARAFQALVDLCEGEATPAGIRRAASEALSRQIILPHTKMPDQSRRRGVKALVSAIRRGGASPIVIAQCAGMVPFVDEADFEFLQRLTGQNAQTRPANESR